ncbi:TPA: NUMOD4 domain-containing protein [Salmonella enterica subsp. enterica serovar Muenchen]
MLSETSKDISGYEGQYAITADGRIYSHSRVNQRGRLIKGRWLKPGVDRDGYLKVCLYRDGEKNYQFVHRLVASAFLDNLHSYAEVNHINGLKKDNRSANLEWVSRSQNNSHAYQSGLKKAINGERHPNAKLNNGQVDEILSSTSISHRELAKRYGVSQVLISRIIRRDAWAVAK